LADANKTTEIKPDWAKGWGRKGTALHGKGEWSKFSLVKIEERH
jgi:stress-induced-phosphoprotein 1